MADWLAEYVNVVTPMLALFTDRCEEDRRRYTLHHQVGLINTCISLQQFILLGNHIEKTEGNISVNRVAQMLSEILHLHADRMVVMADMDNAILEVVSSAMHPVVGRVIETMGVNFDGE